MEGKGFSVANLLSLHPVQIFWISRYRTEQGSSSETDPCPICWADYPCSISVVQWEPESTWEPAVTDFDAVPCSIKTGAITQNILGHNNLSIFHFLTILYVYIDAQKHNKMHKENPVIHMCVLILEHGCRIKEHLFFVTCSLEFFLIPTVCRFTYSHFEHYNIFFSVFHQWDFSSLIIRVISLFIFQKISNIILMTLTLTSN